MTELLNFLDFYKSVQKRLEEIMAKTPRYNSKHDCEKELFEKVLIGENIIEICVNCGGNK